MLALHGHTPKMWNYSNKRGAVESRMQASRTANPAGRASEDWKGPSGRGRYFSFFNARDVNQGMLVGLNFAAVFPKELEVGFDFNQKHHATLFRSRSRNATIRSHTASHSAKSKPSVYSKPARVKSPRDLPTNLTPTDPNSSPSSRSPVWLCAIASSALMPGGRCMVNFLRFSTNGYPPGSPATPGTLVRSVPPVSNDIITRLAVDAVT